MKRKDSHLAPAPEGSDELRPAFESAGDQACGPRGLADPGICFFSRRPQQSMRFSPDTAPHRPAPRWPPACRSPRPARSRKAAHTLSGRPQSRLRGPGARRRSRRVGRALHDLHGRLLHQVKQGHHHAIARDRVLMQSQGGSTRSAPPRQVPDTPMGGPVRTVVDPLRRDRGDVDGQEVRQRSDFAKRVRNHLPRSSVWPGRRSGTGAATARQSGSSPRRCRRHPRWDAVRRTAWPTTFELAAAQLPILAPDAERSKRPNREAHRDSSSPAFQIARVAGPTASCRIDWELESGAVAHAWSAPRSRRRKISDNRSFVDLLDDEPVRDQRPPPPFRLT